MSDHSIITLCHLLQSWLCWSTWMTWSSNYTSNKIFRFPLYLIHPVRRMPASQWTNGFEQVVGASLSTQHDGLINNHFVLIIVGHDYWLISCSSGGRSEPLSHWLSLLQVSECIPPMAQRKAHRTQYEQARQWCQMPQYGTRQNCCPKDLPHVNLTETKQTLQEKQKVSCICIWV
jgi:hypothetical protein